MIVDKNYTITIQTNTKKRYQLLGYNVPKCGENLEVNVFDLPPSIITVIEAICDNCGKHFQDHCYNLMKYKYHHCDNEECKRNVRRKRYFEKTGYETIGQNPKVKAKREETNLKKFGAKNVYASEYGKKKVKEFQDKRKQEKINENSIPLNEYIQQKIRQGEINYKIKEWTLDIAFPNDKICVIVCGKDYFQFFRRGFVWNDIKTNEITFENELNQEGWKIIRVIYMNEEENDNRSKIFKNIKSVFNKAYTLCLHGQDKVVISIDSQNIYYQNVKEDFWYDSK